MGNQLHRIPDKLISSLIGVAFLAILLFSTPAYCQNLQWAKGFFGVPDFFAEGEVVRHDSSGNIYVAGEFRGTVDFDPGQPNLPVSSNGNHEDIFVVKTDSYGNLIWVRTFGSTQVEILGDMELDSVGNVYVTGSFAGVTDFDGGPGTLNRTPIGTSDIFLWKADSNGSFLSVNQHGSVGADVGTSLTIDKSGNLLLAGEFRGTADFDPGSGVFNLAGSSTVITDIFVQKLDPSGNFLWAKRIGGGYVDNAPSVDTDAMGNVIVGGSFQQTVDFDPSAGVFSLTSNGTLDIFILKLSPAGDFVWAKNMGASSGQFHITKLVVNSIGNIISVGDFNVSADFDPGAGVLMLPLVGAYDMFIQCLDASGNLMWVHPFGTTSNDLAYDVGVDSSDNVYFTGSFAGYMDFDPSPLATSGVTSVSNSLDPFIVVFYPNGNFSWVAKTGGSFNDYSVGIDVYPDGSNVTTGRYGGTFDCDPGPNYLVLQPTGYPSKLFLLKLGACLVSRSTVSTIGCDSFAFQGSVYYAAGTYNHVLTNHVGCDSFITMLLTLRSSTSSTLVVDTCGTFGLNGQLYPNSGTYSQVIPNSVGCDSLITLQLTTRPHSATTVSDSSCDSYTFNGQIYTQSGTYSQTLASANGCDSVVTLHLTLLANIHSQTVEACDSFVFSGQTLDSSGTYTFPYVNQYGCDSVEILNLTVGHLQADIDQQGNTLVGLPLGGIYQWVDCNNNYSPIPGANGPIFIPTTTGSYAVNVNYGPCNERSDCVPVVIVGSSPQYQPLVRCHPVPATEKVWVEWGSVADADIQVLSLHGQLLESMHISQQSATQLTLPGPIGIYFLRVDVYGQSSVIKVLKE